MSSDENKGIVDTNSYDHDVDNLFVAGSSVFCRGTLNPPALLIMTLALRLADHLLTRFGD
jgi:choline dehydrogenase-like flavoprotein